MTDANLLGEFLRARRELVRPEDAGLPAGGVRRVPGLRREEVAMLAGISADYYLRLEQGRDRNPSAEVLGALARVLQLDEAATDYLVGMAVPTRRRRRQPRRESVPAGVAQLLETIGLPAFVEGRYFDVLASNALARALSPSLRTGENRLRTVFLDEAERALYPDWDADSARLVAAFRESAGTDADDPRLVELVGELSVASDAFRRLWARHEVARREGLPVRLIHPQVGQLSLRREKLVIAGTGELLLVVFHAEPGSADAEKLAMLGSLAQPPAPAADVQRR